MFKSVINDVVMQLKCSIDGVDMSSETPFKRLPEDSKSAVNLAKDALDINTVARKEVVERIFFGKWCSIVVRSKEVRTKAYALSPTKNIFSLMKFSDRVFR